MSQPRDIAVVLKALEIRAARQGADIEGAAQHAAEVAADARTEREAWGELANLLGGRVDAGGPARREWPVAPPARFGAVGWSTALTDAEAVLRDEGIAPESVVLETAGSLDITDVVACLSFGALGAILPSVGSRGGLVQDAFGQIQGAADSHSLPTLVQQVFGSSKPAAFMDAGAQGIYHRFAHGHDVLWALPEGARNLGLFSGVSQVFQHLLRDSFGVTGIPLPGSTLIGDAVARHLGHAGIADLVAPRDLSRFAGLRMTDAVSTGATSLMLWGYGKIRGIPSPSIRSAKLAILAHGLCSVAVAAIAAVPGIQVAVPYRSRVNYVSLAAVAKNTVQLWQMTRTLRNENLDRFGTLDNELRQLQAMHEDTLSGALDREIRMINEATFQAGRVQ